MPPTPYMGLTLPTVGVTIGPDWANELNAALNIVDSHNHATGNGVPVPSAGIGINNDLTFAGFNATNLRSVRLQNQGSPLANPNDLTSLYASGGNLYYNNSVGNQVQITQGAGLDASSVGGFGGDYGTSTASAFYTSATSTFSFWQAANQSAIMDVGPLVLHPTTTVSNGITVRPPNTLATSYNVILPGAPPVSNDQTLLFDTSGNAAFSKVTLASLAADVIAFLMPVGSIIQSGSTSTPTGYLYCDGTQYTSAAYPALFAAIGTAYGNYPFVAGSFNVPDFRGYFLRGQADGTGTDPDAASRTVLGTGGNSGDNVGSLQQSQAGPHGHGVSDPGHNHTQRGNAGAAGGIVNTTQLFSSNNANAANSNSSTVASTTGVSVTSLATSEDRPKNIYVRYYIKY